MKWILRIAGILIGAVLIVLLYGRCSTNNLIEGHRETVSEVGISSPTGGHLIDISELPPPVIRYFSFVFSGKTPPKVSVVNMAMEGEFRRPLMDSFAPMSATQTTATGQPALLFEGTTPVIAGVSARAFDFYAKGEMEMKARIASILTVVDEQGSDKLNQTSLQRWLLESPLYPTALLPGGVVHWEAIDDYHARAIVEHHGLTASLVAAFRPDGSLESFSAEPDGDLTTSYHGAGEYVLRENYQLVNEMMVPLTFSIERVAGNKHYPFWRGNIININYQP